MIIDSHIHLWSEEIGADPVGWGKDHGEPHFAAMMAPGPAGPQSEWPTPEAALAAMDVAGVDRAIVQGWYWERPETCALHQAWLEQALAAHRDRLSWCVPFHAGGGQEAVDRVRRAVEAGAVGVGELFPPAQGYAWDDPWLAQLLDWAAAAAIPVVLHVTEPVGPAWAGRIDTPLQEIVGLATRHPGLPLVLAHWGGGLPWYALSPPVGRALESAHYDTAAAPRLMRAGPAWSAGLAAAGPSRVLWASDFPLRLYRGLDAAEGWARWHFESAEALKARPPADLAAVLGGNAARVFAL